LLHAKGRLPRRVLLGSLANSEFPRIEFSGNSSQCIKTAAAEGHD